MTCPHDPTARGARRPPETTARWSDAPARSSAWDELWRQLLAVAIADADTGSETTPEEPAA